MSKDIIKYNEYDFSDESFEKSIVEAQEKSFGMEGEWSRGFSGVGELGGFFNLGYGDDGFQRNLTISTFEARYIPTVHACVSAPKKAVGQCKINQFTIDKKGKHSVVSTSDCAKILNRPNHYQTWMLFISDMIAELGFEGESFAVVIRDKNGQVTSIHKCPLKTTSPYIAEDGSIFYSIGSNPMRPMEQDYMVPARDVWHLREHCPRHPLMGESPIKAAALAAGVNVALSRSQAAFFSQMSRPSGIISTDKDLKKDQLNMLREAWKDQAAGINQGQIPILGGGMKFQPLGITSQDAQLIEAQNLSTAEIAKVYGVPLPIIGEMENATLSNVEQMVNLWLSVSLGALLVNIESGLKVLFNLKGTDYIRIDTMSLLRSDFETKISSLSAAASKGIMTPNECRFRLDEGLHDVEHGDVPYMQVQNQPLGSELNPKADEPESNDNVEDDNEADKKIEDQNKEIASLKKKLSKKNTPKPTFEDSESEAVLAIRKAQLEADKI